MMLCHIKVAGPELDRSETFIPITFKTMNILKDIIQHCHQRHEEPLRQRRTVITPALYKGLPYHFTVYCARKYPVKLYELEQADISFMPIGRAPEHDHGPISFGGERFLKRQGIENWNSLLLHRSWGIQVYTGIPSEYNGACWHDLDFKYKVLCVAPDAVLACIETLVNAVANPLLTMSKSGGLRFSCRILDYLHPNTEETKQYIYKHTPTAKNPNQRDMYLEVFGEEGYSRWDARYEILHGSLLDPPVISKEVLFNSIEDLRAELHEPAPLGQDKLKSTLQVPTVAPPSLSSHKLNIAKEEFMRRGFSYAGQDNGFYHWTRHTGEGENIEILLWESAGTVWIRASVPDAGLPMNPTPITDVWEDTGILPPIPVTGLPVSEKVLAVREGKLSPLVIKRSTPALHKPEGENKAYKTLEANVSQIQRAFDKMTRVTGLIAETGAGKSHAVESYMLKGGAISLNAKFWITEEADRRFQKQNLPSCVHWKARRYLWNQVKEIPAEVRMATPFQRGNVCEDPERCDALEQKGGNPSESICPQCPVYTECQQRGYLSQSAVLQRTKTQLSGKDQLFLDPQHSEIAAEMLKQVDSTERLCIIDEAEAYQLFPECDVSKNTLEEWSLNWQGNALGSFAKALLNALETGSESDNPVRRIRTATLAFQRHEEELIRQMCQVNVRGRVVARGTVDAETGKELARFSIEFEGGASAYIPLDPNAADRLVEKGLSFFPLRSSVVLNEDIRIPMLMAQAIQLGILDVETAQNIEEFPTVCPDPNWTLWHQLKRFFAYYPQDADAPMIWYNKVLRFWVPPILHPSVQRLLLMSSTLSEQALQKAFPGEEINVVRIKPTAWVPGNQVFQARTDFHSVWTLLDHNRSWDVIRMSKTGKRIFSGILAEIKRDTSVKHSIVTYQPITRQLTDIAEMENVCFVKNFKDVKELEETFEATEVIWIVGIPTWQAGIIWRHAQILFGNDEIPLSYETETEPFHYKDERVQHVYKQMVTGLLANIVGRVGLNRFAGKKVVLVNNMELPDITDRPETLLFDWEDFEVAGGLHRLEETIHTRERYETERTNLTADTSREEVERILGCSSRQANRVLKKLRGGNIPRVLFREQIFSLLANSEKRTSELVAAIDGHPTSVRNELKRLVDSGEIVKVRWGIYTLPSTPASPPTGEAS